MRTNTDCTIYIYYHNERAGVIEVHKTHLGAVFWEPRKAVNKIQSGMAEADAVSVFIPISVDAENKAYVDPVQYSRLSPEQVDKHWTLTEGADYLARGDAPAVSSAKELKELLPSLYEHFKITTVDPKLYGSLRLRHYEVSGK